MKSAFTGAAVLYTVSSMLRRKTEDGWLLFNQDDHAKLAARIMGFWGGNFFFPENPDNTLFALAEHDCGWKERDANPALNARGEPMDFTEVPPDIQTGIWRRSFTAHLRTHPVASALIALHFKRFNTRTMAKTPNRWSESLDIEIEQFVFRALGAGGATPEILRELEIVRAGDALSLALCCAWERFEITAPLKDGGAETVTVTMESDGVFSLKPWPFALSGALDFEIRCRAAAGREFETAGWLIKEIGSRPPRKAAFSLCP